MKWILKMLEKNMRFVYNSRKWLYGTIELLQSGYEGRVG